MEGFTPVFISSFMWFSLFLLSIFPVYACENYLSSKIYFQCFFLEYLIIKLELLFLHGIRATRFIYYFYRVEECFQSRIPLWRRASRFSPSLFCRLQRVSLRAYQQLQYGFFISYNYYFLQLPWMEIKNLHSIAQ